MGPANGWGLVSRATQQLDKLNPGQKFISLCLSGEQFQSIYLIFECGLSDAQYK